MHITHAVLETAAWFRLRQGTTCRHPSINRVEVAATEQTHRPNPLFVFRALPTLTVVRNSPGSHRQIAQNHADDLCEMPSLFALLLIALPGPSPYTMRATAAVNGQRSTCTVMTMCTTTTISHHRQAFPD